MKKLCIITGILFTSSAYAAASDAYLSAAGHAWASIFGSGPSGAIAEFMRNAQTTNPAHFRDIVSIIAYNETALAIFETNNHIRTALSVLDSPLPRRRNTSTDKTHVSVSATGLLSASMADYTSHSNGDFKTRSTAAGILAQGFVSDGITMGMAYARTMTDTHGGHVYSDATTNGMTIFGKYLSQGGLFINTGIAGGRTSWEIDKSVAGVENDSAYDTNFAAAAVHSGLQTSRGRLSFTPQIMVQYTYVGAGRHTDAAAQEFEKWWHNTMTSGANISMGFDFYGNDFVIRPTLSLGAAYDIIRHGSSNINVRVINGEHYQIPLEIPERTSMRGGLGVTFHNASVSAGLNYQLDARDDYMSHMATINLKIVF